MRPFSGRLATWAATYCGRQLRVFGIDRRGFARDLDHLAGLAQLHLEINTLNRARVQGQIGVGDRLEALRFRRNPVATDWELSARRRARLN